MAASSRSTSPKLLDTAKVSDLVIANIFKYLTDTDLSNLAVNKKLADRTWSDSRWIKKLQRALFNGFYLNYLIDQLGDGKSIVDLPQTKSTEEKDEDSRENRIINQVNAFLEDMKKQGIRHFQTIYARYCKSRYLDKNQNETLNEDQFILFSHHNALIKSWLEQNRDKVSRNESLGLEGRSAIFYLALSGNRDGLHLYNQLGFDFTVTDINGDSIQGCLGLSGNVGALDYAAHELKIDMTKTTIHKKLGVQHYTGRSGSAAALEYSKDHLKLNMKALSKSKMGVPHMTALSGNPHSMWICQNKFKLSMTIITEQKSGVPHFAGESGSKEAILMCHKMKLDMKLKDYLGKEVQHVAASSRKREALKACQELDLDMTLYTEKGFGVQHFAALGGPEMLRFCRDIGLDMKAEIKEERARGIQHILAMIGKPEDFALCTELGLDINKLDAKGDGVEIYAAGRGNSSALRFFKKSGRTFRSSQTPLLGTFGVQHAAAHSGDPLTILTCAEYGLEMKAEPGIQLGAEIHAAHSDNPAALLMMQLLGRPIDSLVTAISHNSENPNVTILAQLMFHHHAENHQYPAEMKTQWDKIAFENRTAHVAAFFLAMSNKQNDSMFNLNGFKISSDERMILKKLSQLVYTMEKENLARVYIYLNYFHLNLVTSNKVSYNWKKINTFTAIMRYAVDQVLNKIHELRATETLENTSSTVTNFRP